MIFSEDSRVKIPCILHLVRLGYRYLAHFKMMAEKRKTTMGHITQDHLKQSKICIPPLDLLYRAHERIDPIFKKQLLHEQENQQLAQLRDWLLPLLMNGQVTVA